MIRLADTGSDAQMLLESGETEQIPLTELPDEDEEQLGEVADLRTAPGRLLAVAAACRSGNTKRKWDPASLERAAAAASTDVSTNRGLAIDALRLGSGPFVRELDLTDSERSWIVAVHAAATGDHETAISALAELPPGRYRPKLALLAILFERVKREGGIPCLEEQVASFVMEEPLAKVLLRAAQEQAGAPVTDELAARRTLLSVASRKPALASELEAGLSSLCGEEVRTPGSVNGLGPNLRALIALRSSEEGLVREDDVDDLPLPIVDDLLDAGAVSSATVLAGSTAEHRTRYLTARIDPGSLDDQAIHGLDHHDERARRAFADGDAEALQSLGDSPIVRHYQALLELRRGKPGAATIANVQPETVEIVRDLVALLEAKGTPDGPAAALSERLVADSSVWPVVVDIAGSTAFAPDAALLARYPAFCEWLALHQAREHLYLGEWQMAVEAADHCLSLAKGETVRDEALNLKACGLHYLDQDARAIGALEEAVAGEHSEALLANIGIVAAGLEPELAAQHLGMLMEEAPTVELRIAAAKRALDIWQSSDPGSWRNSDNTPLPDAFEDPMRQLTVGDIGIEDFRLLVGVLAIYDGPWLANAASLAPSPHKDSLEARFYVARAQDLHEMIKVMGAAMAGGQAPQWVLDERDSLRSAAVDILFENLDEPDSMFGSVALAMVDNHVLAGKEDEVLFSGLGIAGVTYHLSTHNEAVADRVVSLLHAMRNDWQALDSEAKDRLDPIVELATRRVAINRCQARARDYDNTVEVFNSAIDLGHGAQPGSPAYAQALTRIRAVANTCRAIRDEIHPWLPIVDHQGVRQDLDQLIDSTREVEGRCLEIIG
jgi:tetratricopeptide (TPR) repeat protein